MKTSPKVTHCQHCRVLFKDEPILENFCDECYKKYQKWLDGKQEDLCYQPRYDGAYFDDATLNKDADSDKVLSGS